MKSNSSTLLNLFDLGPIQDYFVMVRLNLSSTYRFTSLPYSVTFDGETYNSNQGLMEYEAPRMTNIVDRELYKIRLTDHDDNFSAEFDNVVINRPMRIYLGFKINNVLRLNPNQVILAYQGTIAGAYKEIDHEEGIKEVIIEGASPMSNLDGNFNFITSKNGMDQFSSTDTSFDRIYTGSKSTTLEWGRKE